MFLVVVSFSGCIQNKTVYLTMDDNGSSISINLGDQINVTLSENPSTGYMWNITQLNESLLNLTKDFIWGGSGAIGSPVKHTWIQML